MDWYENYEAAKRHVTRMEDSFPDADFRPEGDWVAALRSGMAAHTALAEVLIHCTQEAYKAGATKKSLAVILDMSPSGLRGLRR
jgi:hypothetical protein